MAHSYTHRHDPQQMIFVDRSAYPAPIELLEFQRESLPRLKIFFATDISLRLPRWPELNFPRRVREVVRAALIELFKSRCAYCGEPADEIDRFRPRIKAGRTHRKVDVDHYWWLAAEWSNLYLCCRNCNSRKGSLFPIEGPAALPLTEGDDLLAERPLLLDPCRDKPEEHLRFHADGTVTALSRRGEGTISLLQLNAPYRVQTRLEPVTLLRYEIDALHRNGVGSAGILDFLASFAASRDGSPGFSATVQSAVQSLTNEYKGVSTPIPPPAALTPTGDLGLPPMVWLEKIELKNFRTIADVQLEFPQAQEQEAEQGQPWIMLLGENGVGKSSLLQAVALASMPDAQRDEFEPAAQWLNRAAHATEGFIRLTFTDGSQRTLSFDKGDPKFRVEGSTPESPLLAYGSTRLLPRRNSAAPSHPTLFSVQNLFDQTHPLVDTEPYFSNTKKIRRDIFELFASSIEKLLPESTSEKITRSNHRLKRDGELLEELSGGYKSILALAMDIMYHLSLSSPDMDTAQGLILLDELELHLHPRWKIRVVEQLRNLFPNARFIVTTHDPLCVQGLRKGELTVLAKHPSDASFVHEQIDVPLGTRADEVLTGPWFGMTSTLDAQTMSLTSEHSALLQRPDRTAEQNRRLEELAKILRSRMDSFGITRTQRAAMAAAAVLFDERPVPHADQLIQRRLKDVLTGSSNAKGDGHA